MSDQQNLLEILDGRSSFSYGNEEYFFRHPTIFEKIKEYSDEDGLRKRGEALNLLSREDLIKRAIKSGKWTEEKESEFSYLQRKIRTGKRAKSKLSDERLIEEYERTLERDGVELEKLSQERSSLTNCSLEDYINSKLHLKICKEGCFLDKSLKKRIPEELASKILPEYIFVYNRLVNLDNLLRASYLPEFFDTIRLSTDPVFVYGSIAKDLTIFQRDLLVCGKLLRSKVENIEKIPKYAMADAVELYHFQPDSKEAAEPMNIRETVKSKGGIGKMSAADKIT